MARNADLESLLGAHGGDVVLVIGNGINRYGAAARVNSWEALLMGVARDCGVPVGAVPQGTALTEFFDVLGLKRPGKTGDLAAEFCAKMSGWQVLDHHRAVIGWADRHGVPVLTTNFEEVLSAAVGARFLMPRGLPFSDFYPWNCRFAHALVSDPSAGFGIWHINGMARYKRSIRLGLTDYMGSAQRARAMFYRGDKQLFRAAKRQDWEGATGWLHLVFNKPLLFVGLALEENEVFLRWLLTERAKYFRKFEDRRRPAWYVHVPNPHDEREAGKHFFLEALGISCLPASGPALDGLSPSESAHTDGKPSAVVT